MASHHARLLLRKRTSRLAGAFVYWRKTLFLILVLAVFITLFRTIQWNTSAAALEFTQHGVGQATGAVGVLGVALGDMQGDGREDVVTAGKDGVKVYIQQENGNFEQKIVDDVRGERVILKDFNADGSPDILVTVDANPSVKVYLSQGDVEYTKTWIGTGSNAAIAAGDIDGDSAIDIVTSLEQGGEYVLQRWMNNGVGVFTSTTLASDTGVTALAIADIDGNGFRDIITGGSKGLQTWDTNDGATWSREDIDTSQTAFTTLAVGDVNGDDGTDIIAGDQGNDRVTYYRHLEHSAYEKIVLTGSADAMTVQVVDLNEDGASDILAVSQDENTIYWFKNDGHDVFSRLTIASSLQSVFGVAVGDIDRDGDLDFVTADHFQGSVYWYERVHGKPVATAPSAISQMTDGSGRVVFTTEVSQADSSRTRLRVQYSTDGEHWYKAYLTAATPNHGKVDLNHDNPYQIGTTNPIDTDVNDSVKLTITWDTKSTKNLGGPVQGDLSSVQLRLIPRDAVGNGNISESEEFRVDNKIPTVTGTVSVTSVQDTEATLTWKLPTDGNIAWYRVYYGTDRTKVSDQVSDEWKSKDDGALAQADTTSTTITGLSPSSTYAFKLIVRDAFGNEAAWPTVTHTLTSEVIATPIPEEISVLEETPLVGEEILTPTASPEATVEVSVSPEVTTTPGVPETPTPAPTPPPTTFDNKVPIADAGASTVVNPSTLVILDGGASRDPEGGVLTYNWKQIAGATVELLSARTANPSFSAALGESYIFQLTVKDERGAASTDLVTVSVKPLPVASTAPVAIVSASPTPVPATTSSGVRTLLVRMLRPIDIVLFIAALVFTSISLIDRALHSLGGKKSSVFSPNVDTPRGRVLHYRSGEPIAGVQVMIYGADGKLRSTDRTNERGEFSSLFPVGDYTLGVHAPVFIFAGSVSSLSRVTTGLVYTGGKIQVTDATKPLDISIPMKPAQEEVGSWSVRFLHLWQSIQYIARMVSWPVFILGSLSNTVFVFLQPGFGLLGIELLYVVLIIIKVAMEVHVRPAYGLVRDAITHVPLDLAVVRLFDQTSKRLIMTRVANSQGKFFALPPSGTYMITVTKPGYAPFSRDNVVIQSEEDSVLQITADLMPSAPQFGLASAQAAVL